MARRRNRPAQSRTTLLSRQQLPPSRPARTGLQLHPPSWYLSLLLLVLSLPFVPILLAPSGRVLGDANGDNATAYYFYNFFSKEAFEQGIIPLWNPHIMLGMPFIGEGQVSFFHPLSMLDFFLKTSVATNWSIALSCVLTGVFFYGYLRALGLGGAASWCGAVTWSFSSAMISRIYAGHLNILLSFVSMPLIMMGWERYRTRGSLTDLAWVAAGYGVMILAYYPQLLYIFSLFLLLYVLIQSGQVMSRHPACWRREGRALLLLGLFLGLGVAIGSIQLLPGLDFVLQSFRQESTLSFASSYSFPPENLLTLIAPGLLGEPTANHTVHYWGRWNFWEMWAYLGILPLMMAGVGAFTAPRPGRLPLLFCAALFLLVGLGRYTPLFATLYDSLPLFDLFRGPSKYTLITLFCLVTLSAHGFEGLFAETDQTKRRQTRYLLGVAGGVLLLTSSVLLLLLISRAGQPDSNWQGVMNWIYDSGVGNLGVRELIDPAFITGTAAKAGKTVTRGMVLVGLSLVLVFGLRAARWRRYLFPAAAALILLDLLGIYLPLLVTFNRSSSDYPLEIERPEGEFPYRPRIIAPSLPTPNIAMKSGYSSPFGYTGNTLKRYNDFITRIQGLDPEKSQAVSQFTSHTPLYRLISADAVAFTKEEFPPGIEPIGHLGDLILAPYERFNDKMPRAFLAAEPRYFAESEEALSYVFSPQVDLVASPAIERQGGERDMAVTAQPLQADETVRVLAYQPNQVELEAQTRQPRELILSSMYEKNWQATVNGIPTAVRPANYAYRAVRVPAGLSRVIFTYRPAAFYWGAAISAVAIVTLLLILIMGNRVRRGQGLPPTEGSDRHD